MGKKEVKESKGSTILLDIYNSLKEGKNPSTISKQLNISKQLLSYYLSKLKSKNLINKIGYGTWETSKTIPMVAEIRGHGFMWKVKTHLKINWIKILTEKQVKYKLIGNSKTISINFMDRKIWLGKNIIIYEPESFLGLNAIDSRKYAVNRLIEVLSALESKLDINLKPFEFQVTRQHYSIIKNSLAIQCNKQGIKINVYNSNGLWFIIDNSWNLNECEQVNPNTALIDNLGVQKYFNSHKDTNFKVTPEYVLNALNILIENDKELRKDLNYVAQNQVSHVKLIEKASNIMDKLDKKLTTHRLVKRDTGLNKSLFDF